MALYSKHTFGNRRRHGETPSVASKTDLGEKQQAAVVSECRRHLQP